MVTLIRLLWLKNWKRCKVRLYKSLIWSHFICHHWQHLNIKMPNTAMHQTAFRHKIYCTLMLHCNLLHILYSSNKSKWTSTKSLTAFVQGMEQKVSDICHQQQSCSLRVGVYYKQGKKTAVNFNGVTFVGHNMNLTHNDQLSPVWVEEKE